MKQAEERARTKDSMKAFAKLTHEVDGEPRIISDPPLIMTFEDLAGELRIPLHRQRLTHRCLVEFRSVEGSVIAKIFVKRAVDITIRLDPEGLVRLKKMQTK